MANGQLGIAMYHDRFIFYGILLVICALSIGYSVLLILASVLENQCARRFACKYFGWHFGDKSWWADGTSIYSRCAVCGRTLVLNVRSGRWEPRQWSIEEGERDESSCNS